MKIQGPNSTNVNPYQRQINNYKKQQKQSFQDDLKISNEAKQLQETNQLAKERDVHVQKIKKLVESGEYKVNHDKVAQKMINFWTNRI